MQSEVGEVGVVAAWLLAAWFGVLLRCEDAQGRLAVPTDDPTMYDKPTLHRLRIS